MALGQYLKETQAELRHVAWPTRTQTVVFTALVALISIFTALYLGAFDYLLTTGLTNFIESLPNAQATVPATSTNPVVGVQVGTTTQ